MLKLAKGLLSHDWEVVESGHADLDIYSFDTAEGQQAWQQHGDGLNALLSQKGNITEPVDILIKKPLRTSNFSDALNLVAEKLSPTTSIANRQVAQKEKKQSVFGNLSKGISKYLNLNPNNRPRFLTPLPDFTAKPADTIVEPEQLQQWLSTLNNQHNQVTVAALLGNLIPLNRLKLDASERIVLLEIYRDFILKLIANRILSVECRTAVEVKQESELISSTLLLLDELNTGYKHMINHYVASNDKPASNNVFLLSLTRTAEHIGSQLLYCYQHYRSLPEYCLLHLHQLYIYCEQMGVLKQQANTDRLQSTDSFELHYKHALLISITYPYKLDRYDVLRLFNLLKKQASHIEIKTLSQRQIESTSDFLMTGHFCIDTEVDHIPFAMAKTDIETRSKPNSRLLNVQPVLLNLEKIFKQTAATSLGGRFDLDIQLLKKVTPQLNTSYEREQARESVTEHRELELLLGVEQIHNGLRNHDLSAASVWKINNHGNGGIMLSRKSSNRPGIYVGDLIGLVEQEQPIRLATVQWLNIDQKEQVFLGLKLLEGELCQVIFTAESDSALHPALILKQDARKLLITNKGVFSPQRQVRISGDDEPYIAELKTLLESSHFFEKCNFKALPAS
jgi:hypothetical protein